MKPGVVVRRAGRCILELTVRRLRSNEREESAGEAVPWLQQITCAVSAVLWAGILAQLAGAARAM